MDIEVLAREAVDCGFKIHNDLGPGLLESVYEDVLAHLLESRGMQVERQAPISFVYSGKSYDNGFRADILVERKLLIELKSIEKLAPVHSKQVLTYLRLLELPLGLLMNFGAATFREGVHRVLNVRANLGEVRVWKE
ncbi:MAG: GxxExxY protein [Alphaproteobacteria bacterium]|nr:GxxExxY protein [Alphaproteobacteria bacterium]